MTTEFEPEAGDESPPPSDVWIDGVYVPNDTGAILDELERVCTQLDMLDRQVTALFRAARGRQVSWRRIAARTCGRFTHAAVVKRVGGGG